MLSVGNRVISIVVCYVVSYQYMTTGRIWQAIVLDRYIISVIRIFRI